MPSTNPASVLLLLENLAPHFSRHRLNGLLAVSLCLVGSSLPAQPVDLEVGVRSTVPDGTLRWNKERTQAEGTHGMVYGILAIKEIENVERLIKPVNEKRVVSLLMDTLDANGFREFVPGEIPDILIVASYGRGEISNPYIRDTGAVSGAQGFPSPFGHPPEAKDSQPPAGPPPIGQLSSPMTLDNAPPGQTITGADARQLFDEKGPGYEAKLQKATYEKLFIRITAFEYPANAKAKPRIFWKTIMVVDDPDHRDLNAVAAAMLTAGGPYFDKVPKDREVEIHKPLPNTHVDVGSPVVTDPVKPAAGK